MIIGDFLHKTLLYSYLTSEEVLFEYHFGSPSFRRRCHRGDPGLLRRDEEGPCMYFICMTKLLCSHAKCYSLFVGFRVPKMLYACVQIHDVLLFNNIPVQSFLKIIPVQMRL